MAVVTHGNLKTPGKVVIFIVRNQDIGEKIMASTKSTANPTSPHIRQLREYSGAVSFL